MGSILPNGKTQFIDADGAPLVGGKVYFYIPGTNTLKTTWQNSLLTIPNSNPVVLDGSGQAVIWGTGAYRQVLTDSDGNTLWDEITQDFSQNGVLLPYGVDGGTANTITVSSYTPAYTALVAGLTVMVLIANTNSGATTLNSVTVTDQYGVALPADALKANEVAEFTYAGGTWRTWVTNYNLLFSPNISYLPTGNPITTLASLNVQGNATSATQREFLLSAGLTSAVGANPGIGNISDKVAGYFGMVGLSGTGNIWALNSVTTASANSLSVTPYTMQGYELDMNNNSGVDYADIVTGPTTAAWGLTVTDGGTNLMTGAILISAVTPQHWHRGIVNANDACKESFIVDLGNATTSIEIFGTHVTGIDMGQASCTQSLLIANGAPISARNSANTGNIPLITGSGTNVILGDAGWTGIFAGSGFSPVVDMAYAIGEPTNQWETVYCVTLVESSDPDGKTKMVALNGGPNPVDSGRFIDAVTPMQYKRKVGKIVKGNRVAGTRTHFGFDATHIRDTAKALGVDFAGYVEDPASGVKGLRQSQLIPILWAEIKSLRARVQNLEPKL